MKDLVQSGLVIVPDDCDVARIVDELEMFFRQFARASLVMKPWIGSAGTLRANIINNYRKNKAS